MERLIRKIREWNRKGSDVVLERVPKEERKILWEADPQKVLETILKVNERLVAKNLSPLSSDEKEILFLILKINKRA